MTTICLSCRNSVPVARFCAICGQPMTTPTSEVAVATVPPGTTPATLGPVGPPPPPPPPSLPEDPWAGSQSQQTNMPPFAATQPASPGQAGYPGLAGTNATQVLPTAAGAGWGTNPWDSAVAASKRLGSGRFSRTVGIAVVTAILLAVAAFVVFAGSEHHIVTGDLSLTDSSSFSNLSSGDSCEGTGGFSDINAGRQVIIEDQTGQTLSTSQFSDGTYDGVSCVFNFEFTGIPKATFYRVHQSGDRGVLQYSYDDMVKSNWTVHLTLGN